MSEELDVFAGAVPPKGGARQNGPAKPRQYRTFKKFNRTPGQAKPNGSPIRGANGEESVNPLLNAPLPTDQKELEPESPANPNRNPDLPEYRLADIQTWPAQAIVDKMVELGVSRSRLVAVGKGESEPISSNNSEAGRAKNRRVEFVVIQ